MKSLEVKLPPQIVAHASDFTLKACGRHKTGSLKMWESHVTGFNMWSKSSKLSLKKSTKYSIMVWRRHGGRFHHANAQIQVVKISSSRETMPTSCLKKMKLIL